MKKAIIGIAASLMMAGFVAAQGQWNNPVVINLSNTTAAPTATWTNGGDRVDVKSVWCSSPTLTNGTMKLINTTSSTNDLSVTLVGSTLYHNADGMYSVEGGGKIVIAPLLSSTNLVGTRIHIYTQKIK
jgi:hypothetical protein